MKSKDRVSLLQITQFLAVGLLLVWPSVAGAQTVVATVPVAARTPRAVAVNPVTNKIYVASCTVHGGLNVIYSGSLTLIDGATNAATVITGCATAVAVNQVTNKVYVLDPGSLSAGIIVIDGTTNSMTALPGGVGAVAVNPVTNKIYVAEGGGIINVINGATNSITTVTDPNANGLRAVAIAVNSATNKIYVANNSIETSATTPGNITVIDGATNSTTTLTDPNAISPFSVAVNSATNKVYVANIGEGTNHGNVTVIDGITNSITTVTDPNALLLSWINGREFAVAVNSATNKIYVANADSNNVTVIDGATNATTTVTEPNAAAPIAVAVDSATNMIYVANNGTNPGSVTVINGATNVATTVIDPNASAPNAIAVNPTTNKIYVTNSQSDNVTVIDAGAAATSHILSVLLTGNGLGSVTSNPAGINCGTSCTASFASGAAVSLTSSPASGSELSGWSTNCTGSATCNLTMSTDDFVTATFSTTIPPDFSLQPASASLTAQRGSQVTDVIAITPVAGTAFRSPIQLSCTVSGLAPMPNCVLSSTSVTPGANSATSTLTVGVPSQSAALKPFSEDHIAGSLYAAFLPLLGLALIGLSPTRGKSKNRRRSLWLVCSLFIACVALLAGCGAGSSQPPPLNYTVTVTATSGAIQHTTQVTVTVP